MLLDLISKMMKRWKVKVHIDMLKKINMILNVAFFPFKDLSFYNNNDLVDIAIAVHDQTNNKKAKQRNFKSIKKFKEKCQQNIISNCEVNSLDEIDLILEKFYPFFYKRYFKNENLTLHEVEQKIYEYFFYIVEQFSRALLTHRDGQVVFKYWKHEYDIKGEFDDFWNSFTESDKVHMFSALGRLLPLDLFVASYYVNNNLHKSIQLSNLYQHVNLADAPLHDVLRNGVAENHVHASAAFNFSLLWQSCMNFNGNFTNNHIGKYLNEFEPSNTNTSTSCKEYILTAQILRIIIAQYLKTSTHDESIFEWIRSNFRGDLEVFFSILSSESSFMPVDVLKECIEKLKREFNIDSYDDHTDYIFSIFEEDKHIKTFGENLFLFHAMKFKATIEHSNKRTQSSFNEFCYLFFRYLRIKNEFYQQVHQTNTIKGLDYFRAYFDRATSGFNKDSNDYYLVMLRNLFQNQYLRKVELRLSILGTEGENKYNIKKLICAYKQILIEDYNINEDTEVIFPRIGIVYHLIKIKDDIHKDWREFEKNTQKIKFIHYGKTQKSYIDKVKMILNLRNKVPYLSNFIIGLDAASLENNTPIHVFAPVFEQARNSDNESMVIVDRDGFIAKQQSLFFTFHAGEDFRHLHSGLRRVDEVIDFCKFHSGDRIGHGIALGVSVEKWVEENEVIVMPRGEYLDNLLWTWGVYTKVSDINYRTYAYLQHKIYSIAKNIFCEEYDSSLSVELLYEVYRLRFNHIGETLSKPQDISIDEWIKRNEWSDSDPKWSLNRLIRVYHDEKYLEKLMEPIFISTSEIEAEMTVDMQRYVRKKVATTGVVIEVNPTSNYAIGKMESYSENQFFDVNLVNDSNLSNIMININSDDPIVFNTNVSNEIAYLYYGMLDKGLGKNTALNWIEDIRKSGMDTSFIRDNISNFDYIRQLNCLIDSLNDPNYCE
ncbi:hypothetical protein CXK86_29200 [Paenibacillus sp. BGI2013]|nr:hypothetical protein CXK86_29200 [Paenibacillus sp. BGI2013]